MSIDDEAEVRGSSDAGQRRRGSRRDGGDDRSTPVTSGAAAVMDGLGHRMRRLDRRDLRSGWLVIAGVAIVVTVVNAFTVLADTPGIESWEPWLWEGTSMGALLLLLWIPWLTITLAPPDDMAAEGWRPKATFLAIHAAGLLAYSALHVLGFIWLRDVAYRLIEGGPYVFGDRFIYELRKDLLSYALFVFVFWVTGYLRSRRDEPVRPVSFDIRDGARIIRTSLSDIVAVSSAGNYVEFWLADGRRPLMRATLAAIEVELGSFGFVRAHRSWLVNGARVTGLRPDGSGDWTVELGAIEAPLSRRYPQALERLRSPG